MAGGGGIPKARARESAKAALCSALRAREAMNGRIHERHMLDRVMAPGARQARQGVCEDPAARLASRVQAVQRQGFDFARRVTNRRYERSDQVGAVQSHRRSEMDYGEIGEALIHVPAQ